MMRITHNVTHSDFASQCTSNQLSGRDRCGCGAQRNRLPEGRRRANGIVEILTQDEQKLVDLFREAKEARPQTASSLIDIVSCYVAVARSGQRNGSFAFSHPLAVERGVTDELTRMLEGQLEA